MKKLFCVLLVLLFMLTAASCTSDVQTPDVPDEELDTSSEYEVTFLDFDGSVLKTEKVDNGSSANPPVGLKREGYKFVKWDTSFDEVTKDTVVKAVYEEITKPTIITDTVYAEGRDVVVKVNIKKNPGVLTLTLNTIYVESAMKLTKVESGKAMEGYTFVGPKNLSNACNAAWYTTDVSEKVTDGEVVLLHFRLNEDISHGAYKITVSCDNGAYDAEYKEIIFENIEGYIIVDSAVKIEEDA